MTKIGHGHIETGTPEADLWQALEAVDNNAEDRHQQLLKQLAKIEAQMTELARLLRTQSR